MSCERCHEIERTLKHIKNDIQEIKGKSCDCSDYWSMMLFFLFLIYIYYEIAK